MPTNINANLIERHLRFGHRTLAFMRYDACCSNDHARAKGTKPWRYSLIPDDGVVANATLAGLMATYGLDAIREDAVAA